MCVSCWAQGIERGAAAGNSSAAIGLVAAGLSNLGLRGLADRVLATRFDWVTPRRVKAVAGVVSLVVLVVAVTLTRPTVPL